MTPIRTKDTTRVLGAPQKWDEVKYGKCAGLPVVDGDGIIFSYWRVRITERIKILCGRPVRLSVKAETTPISLATQPPVMLDTEKR